VPSEVFETKIAYDASHFWKDKPEEAQHIDHDVLSIDFSGTAVAKKYDVGAELGSGATSIVYAAKAKDTGKDVAIKVISPMTAVVVPKSQWKEAGKRLADSAGKGVVALVEEIAEGDALYLILERLHGPLTGVLVSQKEFKWTEKDVASVVGQLLRALRRVHKKGHVHNDLNVGNILSNADATEVFLAGFAKATTGESSTSDLTCPAFLKPPEVVKKLSHGKAVDLWQLGCLSHLLLSGKWPFGDSNVLRLNVAIQEGKLAFAAEDFGGVSEGAKDFVRQLLQVDPAQRLKASKAQEHAWIKEPPTNPLPTAFQARLAKTLGLKL